MTMLNGGQRDEHHPNRVVGRYKGPAGQELPPGRFSHARIQTSQGESTLPFLHEPGAVRQGMGSGEVRMQPNPHDPKQYEMVSNDWLYNRRTKG